MGALLSGFFLLGVYALVGYLLARFEIVGVEAQRVVSRICFFAATPALIFTTMLKSNLAEVFHLPALVSILVSLLIYAGWWIGARVRGADAARATIGALAASYVNAGNAGIPILIMTLGSASAAAPVIMLQLLFLAPLSFLFLDDRMRGRSR